jgi:mannosyl-3-phosphoglycerate phosphatase
MKKVIIFTDLDGTLLDYSTYSFEKALPALQLVRERDIPLIICSSKTAKEVI